MASSIVSIVSALLLYLTFWNRGDEFQIVFVIAAFLLAVGGWQLSTFFVGLKLRKHFSRRAGETLKSDVSSEQPNSLGAKTKELLNPADFSNQVGVSVVENTTRHLSDKVPLSQTEQKPDRQI